MRRATVLGFALAVGTAGLAGCGEEKHLPATNQVPTEKEGQAPATPTASQPEAAKLVERCLKAATDGHPERIDRAKVNRLVTKGTVLVPEIPQPVPTTRTISGVWSDRVRVEFEFAAGDRKQLLLGLHRPIFWGLSRTEEGWKDLVVPNPQEYADILGVDVVGQYWLLALVPLTDPKTVVFDAKRQSPGGTVTDLDTVKVTVPGCAPVFTLWFDEKTHLIGQVTYTHQEGGSRFNKRVVLGGHKPSGGVQLPGQIAFSRSGQTVEQWVVSGWEFVDKIDDAAFDRPTDLKK